MPEVIANGIPIHYEIHGRSGPPLLMIIGYRLSARAWPERFIERLAERYTVITFDNRGTGLSGKPDHGYQTSSLAHDAAGLLDALGIRQAAVLGYSLGGTIAQEFACMFPRRVERLVLCGTWCGRSHSVFAPPEVVRLLKNPDGLPPAEAGRLIWPVTYAPDYLAEKRHEAEAQLQREIVYPTPDHAAKRQLEGAAFFDTYYRLPGVRVPALVMTGARDVLIPSKNSIIIAARLPDVRLHLFEGRGHRVFWEAPEQTAQMIADFLAEESPR